MREHPKVQVTISVDRAQAHSESTSARATNVTAVADTGAQVNVWSLDEFVKYGFSRDILTPASNLVAANHSSISIGGRSLPSLKDCRVTVMLCNAGPWSTLAPTFRPSSYRMAYWRRWGCCPPVSLSLGKHANAETQECAGEPAAISNAHLTRTVTGDCASPGDQNHSCTSPQRTAVPPPPRLLPFCCIPENNDRIKTWLLERYASFTFNTCPHRPLHCMAGPPIEIHVSPLSETKNVPYPSCYSSTLATTSPCRPPSG